MYAYNVRDEVVVGLLDDALQAFLSAARATAHSPLSVPRSHSLLIDSLSFLESSRSYRLKPYRSELLPSRPSYAIP